MGNYIRFRSKVESLGFVQIPNIIIRDSRITDTALRTYMILLSYAWDKHACFPGIDRMAKDRDVGERTIRRSLKILEDLGLVTIERRGGGKTNIYWMESVSDVYCEKDNVSKLSQESLKFCDVDNDQDDDSEIDFTDRPIDDLSNRLTRGAKSVENAKEKAKIESDRKYKKRMKREIQKAAGLEKKKKKSRPKANTTILWEAWSDSYREKFPNITLAPWGIVDKKVVKDLVGIYGIDLVKKVFDYVITNWQDIAKRHKLNGHPNVRLISGYKTTFFPEVESGKVFDNGANMDEYNDPNNASKIGW